ncbi:MAG: hypothetical protein AABN95_25395 [Acidobacteriota bacterium]
MAIHAVGSTSASADWVPLRLILTWLSQAIGQHVEQGRHISFTSLAPSAGTRASASFFAMAVLFSLNKEPTRTSRKAIYSLTMLPFVKARQYKLAPAAQVDP